MDERMGNAIAAMAELQPQGNTLDSATIQTKVGTAVAGIGAVAAVD